MDTSKIKKYSTVYTKDEGNIPRESIGNVEHIDGEKYIKLTRNDSPDRQHHWVPIDWVESIDEQAVYLNKSKDEIITELMVYHCRSGI